MFTGIIVQIGTVAKITQLEHSIDILIQNASKVLVQAKIGDSICVDGCCLTIVTIPTPDSFSCHISQETLNCTCFRSLKLNTKLNLEAAMSFNSKFDGHLVQGHVDSVAIILTKEKFATSYNYTFKISQEFVKYIVKKGYVAVNGTSLTVTKVDYDECTFGVMLIPHTQENVNLAALGAGAVVNIEFDVFGKYITAHIEKYLPLIKSKI